MYKISLFIFLFVYLELFYCFFFVFFSFKIQRILIIYIINNITKLAEIKVKLIFIANNRFFGTC